MVRKAEARINPRKADPNGERMRLTSRLLTDSELAAGIGVAVEEGDEEWVKSLVLNSEAYQGFPPEMLDEFVSMIMGALPTQDHAAPEPYAS